MSTITSDCFQWKLCVPMVTNLRLVYAVWTICKIQVIFTINCYAKLLTLEWFHFYAREFKGPVQVDMLTILLATIHKNKRPALCLMYRRKTMKIFLSHHDPLSILEMLFKLKWPCDCTYLINHSPKTIYGRWNADLHYLDKSNSPKFGKSKHKKHSEKRMHCSSLNLRLYFIINVNIFCIEYSWILI